GYFPYAKDKFELVNPEQSKTETLSQTILSANMFFGDTICTLLTFLNRSKIIRFHENLAKFLIEDVSKLTQAERKVVMSVVLHALKILTRYKRIIYFAFYCSVGAGVVKSFYVVFTAEKPLIWWSHSLIGLPIVFLFWGIASTLRLLPRLLMITILYTFRICPYITNIQLEKVNQICFVTNEDCQRILSSYRKQEMLTAQLNDAFGWCLTVDMLLMVISLITLLFSVLVCLSVKEYAGAFSFGWALILHAAIVFELCNASYVFEAESRKSAILLKNIPIHRLEHISRVQKFFIPLMDLTFQIIMLKAKLLSLPLVINPGSFFHVNRRTITGIFSAITTYLIVLVQFHNGED
ncbi:Gustatory and odorant receptor 63a, partial [Orchesella cincta]